MNIIFAFILLILAGPARVRSHCAFDPPSAAKAFPPNAPSITEFMTICQGECANGKFCTGPCKNVFSLTPSADPMILGACQATITTLADPSKLLCPMSFTNSETGHVHPCDNRMRGGVCKRSCPSQTYFSTYSLSNTCRNVWKSQTDEADAADLSCVISSNPTQLEAVWKGKVYNCLPAQACQKPDKRNMPDGARPVEGECKEGGESREYCKLECKPGYIEVVAHGSVNQHAGKCTGDYDEFGQAIKNPITNKQTFSYQNFDLVCECCSCIPSHGHYKFTKDCEMTKSVEVVAIPLVVEGININGRRPILTQGVLDDCNHMSYLFDMSSCEVQNDFDNLNTNYEFDSKESVRKESVQMSLEGKNSSKWLPEQAAQCLNDDNCKFLVSEGLWSQADGFPMGIYQKFFSNDQIGRREVLMRIVHDHFKKTGRKPACWHVVSAKPRNVKPRFEVMGKTGLELKNIHLRGFHFSWHHGRVLYEAYPRNSGCKFYLNLHDQSNNICKYVLFAALHFEYYFF